MEKILLFLIFLLSIQITWADKHEVILHVTPKEKFSSFVIYAPGGIYVDHFTAQIDGSINITHKDTKIFTGKVNKGNIYKIERHFTNKANIQSLRLDFDVTSAIAKKPGNYVIGILATHFPKKHIEQEEKIELTVYDFKPGGEIVGIYYFDSHSSRQAIRFNAFTSAIDGEFEISVGYIDVFGSYNSSSLIKGKISANEKYHLETPFDSKCQIYNIVTTVYSKLEKKKHHKVGVLTLERFEALDFATFRKSLSDNKGNFSFKHRIHNRGKVEDIVINANCFARIRFMPDYMPPILIWEGKVKSGQVLSATIDGKKLPNVGSFAIEGKSAPVMSEVNISFTMEE